MQDGSLENPIGKKVKCEGPELLRPPPFPLDLHCHPIIYKECPDGSVIEHFYNSGITPGGGGCVYNFIKDCEMDSPAVAAPGDSCCELSWEKYSFLGARVEGEKHGVSFKWELDMIRVGDRIEWRDPAEDPTIQGFRKCGATGSEITESGTTPNEYTGWQPYNWNSARNNAKGERLFGYFDRRQRALAASEFGHVNSTIDDFPNVQPRYPWSEPTRDDRVLIFWRFNSGCRDYKCCVLILVDYNHYPFGVRRRGPVCGRHCRRPNVIPKYRVGLIGHVPFMVRRNDVQKMFDVMGPHMGPVIVDNP